MNAAILLLGSTLGVGADHAGPGCRGGDRGKATAAATPACGLGEDCEKKRTGLARLVPPPRKQPVPKDPCPGCDDQPTGLLGVIAKGPKKPAAKDPCPGCDKPHPPATLMDALKNHKHHKTAAVVVADPPAAGPACVGCAGSVPLAPLPAGQPVPGELSKPPSDAPPKGAAAPTGGLAPASGPKLNGPNSPY